MHLYLEMHDSVGNLLAWNEQVLLHVTRSSGKPEAAAFPEKTAHFLAGALKASTTIMPLPHTNRRIGLISA